MFEFIDKIKDKYRQNRVEKLLNVQKSLREIEERIDVLFNEKVAFTDQSLDVMTKSDNAFERASMFDELVDYKKNFISELAQLKLNKNKLLKSEQSLQKEDPLFKSMYDHMRFESTYKEVTKGYRQGQIDLDRCDEILKAINNDKKVKYSDNLIFNTEGKLLLLKRSELDKTFPGMYTIPGGHVDAGEDHRTAAIRELQEESGLTPDKDSQFTKVGEYEDDKVCIEYFLSYVDNDSDTLCLQSEEAWQYEWVESKELDKYEFPLNMKQNIQKILYPNKEVIVKLGKAFKNGKIDRDRFMKAVDVLSKSEKNYDELLKRLKERRDPEGIEDDDIEEEEVEKASSHKYISKKPDGKGGWEYEYEEEKNRKEENKFEEFVYHATNNSEDILKEGFNEDKIRVAFMGQGFSFSPNYTDLKDYPTNKDILKVKVQLSNPLRDSKVWLEEANKLPKGLTTEESSKLLRDNLEKLGYDGIVATRKGGWWSNSPNRGDEIVAFRKTSIKKVDKYVNENINHDTEKSLQSINELYLQNKLSDELYEKIIEKAWNKSPIGTITTRSNGQKWKKVSETGNKDQDWQLVSKPKVGSKTDESVSKEKRAEYGTKGEQPTISEHAKQSSETALNAAIKESQDPEVREAAHQELDRRQKEEHVQEEEKKDGGEKKEANKHVEKFRQLSDDQIKFYLDAPYPEVKEAAKMVADERGLSVVSKEDYIKSFEDFDENPETNEDHFYKNDSRKSFDYLEKNEDISSSLSSYKFDGFLTIREYLSDTDSFSKENEYLVDKLKKDTDNISKFIKDNPLSKNLTLHRRCLSDSTFFTKLKENDIYEDKSFSSTSLQQRAEFGDFHIKILAKSGSRVSNINNKREFEYLIDKGSKFRVIERHENGLGITVELL